MIDPYAATAEFYDLVAAPLWARKGPVLADALRQARPDRGPILDIGAGTGLSTEVIADALPDARIIAVEPSSAMRIALATRIAVRGLTGRITIVADPVDGLSFPDRLGGAVAYGVLGHLPAADRTRLLTTLGQRLAPGAPAVVELLDETAPPTPALSRIARVPVGEHHIEVWSRGGGDDSQRPPDGPVRWTLTYRLLRGNTVLRTVETPMPWTDYDLTALRTEARRAGLSCTRVAPDVAVLTRGDTAESE
ncbi:trans-aconitate 2-methyltransferase [Nocardia sp. CC227C]|uniref:class I SAM-dependent methyltransferase n=1 Tax=Nocardia sp. CC227C TaxID=3044562 RepID=UPI00278BE2B2|nr:class I SAM-dependent methyltransferase [Nocardia sp. CC227C]